MVWNGRGTAAAHAYGQAERVVSSTSASASMTRPARRASSDGTARVWDLTSGERVSIMSGHGNQVRRASFGANEDSVLTASRDGTARTWKVDTGGMRAVFIGHTELVTAAAFVSGDRLVTASRDGTVRTWFARSGRTLMPAHSTPAPPRPTLDPRATVTGAARRLLRSAGAP